MGLCTQASVATRPNAPAVVAGQWGFLLRGLRPGLLLQTHTHTATAQSFSSCFPWNPPLPWRRLPHPGGDTRSCGSCMQDVIQAHPVSGYPQLCAVPTGAPKRNPGTCLPSSPLRASTGLPAVSETERQSSGIRQLL